MWTRRDLYVVYLQTTLLDVLADRKTGGKIEGDIRVNVCTPACLEFCCRAHPLSSDIYSRQMASFLLVSTQGRCPAFRASFDTKHQRSFMLQTAGPPEECRDVRANQRCV